MKKSIIGTVGGLVFATLFYTQSLGVNALMYSIFLIIALAVSNKNIRFKNTIILSGLAMLSSATAICMHGATWSIVTYFFSTLMYIGYIASFQSSIYVSWINGVYNSIFGMFHSFLYQLEEPKIDPPKKSIDISQLTKTVLTPLVLIVVFTVLYSTSNPVFSNFLAAMDFSFIDVFWIFTAALGACIMANIQNPQPIKNVTEQDLNYPNELAPKNLNEHQLGTIKKESQIGFISLVCLNILLAVVLITEVLFLTDMPDTIASVLSDAVHQGVYASMVSIILAIGVIAFIFRGDVNFIKNNENLRLLTYTWIGLNVLLVVGIFLKNYMYIHLHGLTHKRIGVLVYLLLTFIGLGTTYLKVSYRLNFVYLLRRNMAAVYVVLSIYALFNWSSIITEHNIKADKMTSSYLESLLPQNALVLKKHGLYKKQTKRDGYSTDRYDESEFINRNWQEFNWIAYKIKQDNEPISQQNTAAE
jgi:hypothetical protein